MKVSEALKMLSNDGWVQVDQRGSHRQFKHPVKRGKVTVAGRTSLDIPPGTLRSILRQAGLTGKMEGAEDKGRKEDRNDV